MIANSSISRYFENTEAGRGPPTSKKETFFVLCYHPIKEIEMNHPKQTTGRNYNAPPHSFESTLSPPNH
jgi:hypothetical protein